MTPESIAAMKQKVFMALPQHELGRYVAFEKYLENVICPPNTVRERLCGIYIANLQNALARQFLATDFEYFWLLNDDQPYPPDTLIRLLLSDMDIVVPLAVEKAAPHFPLIYEKGQNGLKSRFFLKRGMKGLVPIAAAGGGGMLIHRRVFEAIPDPWWTVTTRINESGIPEQTSEDFDFCDRVAAAGFQMYCNLDASVYHVAQYALRPMMDAKTGEWYTVLCRETEQIPLPAAAPAPSPIEIHQHIPVLVKG